jgi:hypothetical protein
MDQLPSVMTSGLHYTPFGRLPWTDRRSFLFSDPGGRRPIRSRVPPRDGIALSSCLPRKGNHCWRVSGEISPWKTELKNKSPGSILDVSNS